MTTETRFRRWVPRTIAAVCITVIGWVGGAMDDPCHAQMGGSGGASAPAFEDPSFREKLYEAGGFAEREGRQGAVILSVTIEGNQSVSESFILSQMQSREDRAFDKETFNRDISALYRTNLFRKVDPYFASTEEGVHIRLIISEKPIIRSVSFLGNERLEEGSLTKHAGLTKGDPLDPIALNSAKSRLVELYQDKGMNQIDIQIRKGLKPSERDVEFLINEGPVERINSIRVIGNEAFGEDLLKARITSRDSRWGFTRFFGNQCSDLKLEQDRESLLGYYRSLGYFDARVDFHKAYNDAGDFVDVTFVVYEGNRYSIHSVSIAGMQRYQPSDLMPYLLTKANEPFLQINKLKDERLLADVFGAQGHIFCDVEGEVIYQPNHRVDIVYHVKEGDVYRASDIRVHIDGDFTKRHVVLQPLRNLRPGEIIDRRELEAGERRLKYSTIFNTDPTRGELPRVTVKPPEDLDYDRE